MSGRGISLAPNCELYNNFPKLCNKIRAAAYTFAISLIRLSLVYLDTYPPNWGYVVLKIACPDN